MYIVGISITIFVSIFSFSFIFHHINRYPKKVFVTDEYLNLGSG
jgi:hypothetical protein